MKGMIHRHALRFVLIVALASFAAPAHADGQGTNAPPGNSAVDEYVETVPSAGGPKHRVRTKKSTPDPRRSVVPSNTRAALRAQGVLGASVLAAAEAGTGAAENATTDDGSSNEPGTSDGRRTAAMAVTRAAESDAPSVPTALLQAAFGRDGSGTGVLVPAVLAASVLGAGGVLLTRWRRKA